MGQEKDIQLAWMHTLYITATPCHLPPPALDRKCSGCTSPTCDTEAEKKYIQCTSTEDLAVAHCLHVTWRHEKAQHNALEQKM